VHQYHAVHDFPALRPALLAPLAPLIAALPGAVASSTRPPALLRLLHALVQHPETAAVIVAPPAHVDTAPAARRGGKKPRRPSDAADSGDERAGDSDEHEQRIVQTLIRCVAARSSPDVSTMVMDGLSVLLDRDHGRALLPHAHLVIQCFSKRFAGPGFDETAASLKLSEMKITPTGSVKQELQLLCRIAEGVFARGDVDIAQVRFCVCVLTR